MKRFAVIVITLFIVHLAVIVCIRNWRYANSNYETVLRDATRYEGATGPSIKKYDNNIDRWINEMKEEPVEVILQKLTDAAEFEGGLNDTPMSSGMMLLYIDAKTREQQFHSIDIETILSHRRFRKAYEDLQKMDKTEAAKLLNACIKDNLIELRKGFQKDIQEVSQGSHKGERIFVHSYPVVGHYRSISRPDIPPTRLGRRYAVLTYIWLAALLELHEVRPVINEVIQLAKEEFQLFCNIEINVQTFAFRMQLIQQSLYNPSLLVTATICDPAWQIENKSKLTGKLENKEIVDFQARSTEYNWHGREGWVPVKPHEKMLKIRYYKGITDEEFNAFFGE